MARCEDFPCCGHESGCCPSYDEDGNQIDMKCTCGASVPLNSRSSLCSTCLRGGSRYADSYEDDCDDDDDYRGMADPHDDYDDWDEREY